MGCLLDVFNVDSVIGLNAIFGKSSVVETEVDVVSIVVTEADVGGVLTEADVNVVLAEADDDAVLTEANVANTRLTEAGV